MNQAAIADQLCDASASGDVAAVQKLFVTAFGAIPPEALRHHCSHALSIAAHHGHLDLIHSLHAAGASVEWRDQATGRTPLILAAARAHLRVVDALLKHGADRGATGRDGATALTVAAACGHELVVRRLLTPTVTYRGMATTTTHTEHGGFDIDARDAYGTTALWLSCRNGHVSVVECLLDRGADPTVCDARGWRPLQVAADSACEGLVQEALREPERVYTLCKARTLYDAMTVAQVDDSLVGDMRMDDFKLEGPANAVWKARRKSGQALPRISYALGPNHHALGPQVDGEQVLSLVAWVCGGGCKAELVIELTDMLMPRWGYKCDVKPQR